ncbi:MAG: DUF21 domain-containing protein [Phycisphaeraceae bacterium]|nr:MAG: DUF21 domain-containing protein [Phycisphaeraceae bacterium]
MSGIFPLILVLPVLIVFSAIASGAETALFRLSHRERAELRRAAPAAGAAVESLLGDARRLLLFVLLMNMVVNVAYFVVSSVLTTRASNGLIGAAVGLGSVLAIVLFGEILAKIVAGSARMRFCVLLAQPLAALQVLLGPVVVGVDRLVLAPLIRVIRPHHADFRALHPAELDRLIETGGKAGVLTESERRLLGEVIELGQIRAREAMRPRDRIVWLPADATAQQIIKSATANRRTTILLVEQSLDGEVAGFLHVKRYLAARCAAGSDPDPHGFVDPPLFIPEQTRLDAALDRMRRRSCAQALCVDEHGGVVGLLDSTDIVGELLAGMGDERSDEKHTVRLVGLGVWSVPARLAARDWAQYFSVRDPEFDAALARASTIGGIVIDRLGRLPKVGDSVEIGSLRVRVESVTGRRIDGLLVELLDERPPEAGENQPEEDGA